MSGGVVGGLLVPGLPHPLLVPDAHPGYGRLRSAFDQARSKIESLKPDVLVLYSTQWVSVIGHQIQADPKPTWIHVDQEWHALGDLPYTFAMDSAYANAYQAAATARGLHARTVSYYGFPIDTGTIVALKLLDPSNAIPACVVSCNMYADRAETIVLGKAAADALHKSGKRAVAVAVSALSNRLLVEPYDPAKERISSLKDDEWNRKMLEILAKGRLEDVCQLAREFTAQANGDMKLKALWWLAAAMGQHNNYSGEVLGYESLWGTGGAVATLVPSAAAAAVQEYDEENVERFRGERSVLSSGAAAAAPATTTPAVAAPMKVALPQGGAPVVRTASAPTPLGAYPHARRVGDLLYLSGIGPRQPGTDAIPGGAVRNPDGSVRDYDAGAQTRAVIENVKAVLEASGSSLHKVLDVTAFLIDMERDFPAYNAVYNEYFKDIQATRTTLAISALPTPIAVEFKVIASAI